MSDTSTDYIDELLTSIVTKITHAPLTDDQKADALSRVSRGLHELTWPLIVDHIPESKRKEILQQTTPMTVEQYSDIMKSVFEDPEVGKKLFDRVYAALSELNTLIDQSFK